MPSVTVPGSITSGNAEGVLERELGERFTVEPRGDSQDKLKVKLSALTYANVRLDRHDQDTTFHVHGGGFVIGRAVNELGIARDVATALRHGYGQ